MRRVLPLVMLLLAGCIDPATDDRQPDATEPAPEPWQAFFVNRTGDFGAVAISGTQDESFEVPNGTARMTINLLWQDPVASVELDLESPDGTLSTYATPGDGRIKGDLPNPTPGTWTAHIRASNAVGVSYSFSAFISPDGLGVTVLEETVTIAAGSFFEINTQMDEGARIHWDWTTDADSPFNVHTHFDDEVQYLVEVTASAHAGAITQNRTGGLSLMWEADTPTTLHYKAWGAFEVDSYFPPR